jgi:hypothetical protein
MVFAFFGGFCGKMLSPTYACVIVAGNSVLGFENKFLTAFTRVRKAGSGKNTMAHPEPSSSILKPKTLSGSGSSQHHRAEGERQHRSV